MTDHQGGEGGFIAGRDEPPEEFVFGEAGDRFAS